MQDDGFALGDGAPAFRDGSSFVCNYLQMAQKDNYIHGDVFSFLKYSWFTTLCQSLLYSKVTQLYTHMFILFYIFFHYALSQETGYNSLCYTIGPYSLSILYIIVGVYQPQTPSPSLSLPSPSLATTLLSVSGACFCLIARFVCAVF